MEHSPFEKLTGSQLVRKFPVFYGTRRFITAITSARHLFLSRPRWNQSINLHPTSWRPVVILSSHLCFGLPSGLFPSGFPTKTLYAPLLSPIPTTYPVHLILLDLTIRTTVCEEYRSLSHLLCSFLHSPVTSSLLGSNILLSILFSNTLSLRSSLNMSDQVSHPYKTTGKIIGLRSFRQMKQNGNGLLATHMACNKTITYIWPLSNDFPPGH